MTDAALTALAVLLAADLSMRFGDRRRLKVFMAKIDRDHAEFLRMHTAALDEIGMAKASALSAARASGDNRVSAERIEHKVDDAAALAARVADQLAAVGGPTPVVAVSQADGSVMGGVVVKTGDIIPAPGPDGGDH